jgi:hypothetical protein
MTTNPNTLPDLIGHFERRIDYKKQALISDAESIIEKMEILIRKLKDGRCPNEWGELYRAGSFNAACGELAQLMQEVEEMKGWAKADRKKTEQGDL